MSTEQNMETLTKAVARVAEIDTWFAEVAKRSALKQAERKGLMERLIPDLLATMELASVKTLDGLTVSTKPVVSVTIPKDMTRAAMDWLIESGHGGIVKSEVSVSFRAGDAHARELEQKLKEDGMTVTLEETVHAQTLGKWGREMIEKGALIPECFTVYTGRTAVITEEKSK